MLETLAIKPFIRKILENPLGHDWSLQGLGMLRLYITPSLRLHVWSKDHRVYNATEIHSHPWDMTSHVIVGFIENQRYKELPNKHGKFIKHKLHCGAGGGLCGTAKPVTLHMQTREFYTTGKHYQQTAKEIHLTIPSNGTVTLVERSDAKDPDHAYVYFQETTGFVPATPRKATQFEVLEICHKALTKNTW